LTFTSVSHISSLNVLKLIDGKQWLPRNTRFLLAGKINKNFVQCCVYKVRQYSFENLEMNTDQCNITYLTQHEILIALE
jgi:hypothetical protein